MASRFRITADDVSVKPSDEEPTPVVKKLIDQKPENVWDTPDDWIIELNDVKGMLPDTALDTIKKEVFKGRKKMTVQQLKKIIDDVEEDDDQFWVSVDQWSGGQKAWSGKEQFVIQINISDKIKSEIKKDPLVADFFDDFFKWVGANAHPAHTQTLAWARVYRFPDKWIIEEIQSDLFGASRNIGKDASKQLRENVLNKYDDAEIVDVSKFLMERFEDWDKQLVGLVISMARKAGVKDIYMFDEDWKKAVYKKINHPMAADSVIKKFYRKIPRDLGFRKVDIGKELHFQQGSRILKETWHRAVASITEKIWHIRVQAS